VTRRWSVPRWRHQSIVFTVWRHTICEANVCGCGSLKFQSTFCPWPQLFSPLTFAGYVGSTASGSWVHSPRVCRVAAKQHRWMSLCVV